MSISFLYCTTSDVQEAEKLSALLLEAKLIACANITPSIHSVFMWEGQVQNVKEASLIAKTTTDMVPHAIAFIEQNHSYDCPAILSWKADSVSSAFADWIKDNINQ